MAGFIELKALRHIPAGVVRSITNSFPGVFPNGHLPATEYTVTKIQNTPNKNPISNAENRAL